MPGRSDTFRRDTPMHRKRQEALRKLVQIQMERSKVFRPIERKRRVHLLGLDAIEAGVRGGGDV